MRNKKDTADPQTMHTFYRSAGICDKRSVSSTPFEYSEMFSATSQLVWNPGPQQATDTGALAYIRFPSQASETRVKHSRKELTARLTHGSALLSADQGSTVGGGQQSHGELQDVETRRPSWQAVSSKRRSQNMVRSVDLCHLK